MQIYLNRYKFFNMDDEIEAKSGRTYEVSERIGSGGNGAVYECIDQSGVIYAVKFLLHFSVKSKKRFMQEVLLMQKLHHPHIIGYVDEGVVTVYESKDFQNGKDALFVIMERADSNLKDFLLNSFQIPYAAYAPQFRGMCEALKEIHEFAIHRDIKPENILIKGETWVLSDFGLCEFIDPQEHNDITGGNEKVGPIFWISPEAVNKYYFEKDEIGTYSDVYQMGMIFALVLMKKYPGGIIDNELNLNTTEEIKYVVLKSLNNDYTKRPQNGSELLNLMENATVNK